MKKKTRSFSRVKAVEMIPFYPKMHLSQGVPPSSVLLWLGQLYEPKMGELRHVFIWGHVSLGRESIFSLSSSLCMFSLSSDKANHQPFPSEPCVRAQGMCLFACRVTNLRLNQASSSFIAWGNLQTLNSISGLVLYILERIFTNHWAFCFGGQVSSCCSITGYCCYGKGSITFSTVKVPPLFLPQPPKPFWLCGLWLQGKRFLSLWEAASFPT